VNRSAIAGVTKSGSKLAIEPRPSNDSRTDEDLLSRIRSGEMEHFGELVRRYERELFGYLRRYVGSDDLAADVFQNTFIAVFRKIEHYQPGRAARPWLYTIATHQAIDALRRRNRRIDHRADLPLPSSDDGNEGGARSFTELIFSQDPGPPASAETDELRGLVRAAIDQLPELWKQVIVLAYFQGLRYHEIAETLEIPLGTVKSRLHAAVARLTEIWQASGHSREL